jgi:uncharacterized protein YjiS (DUF1127 family)
MGTIVNKIIEGLRQRRRFNRTVNELSKLTNRDLADLGINRTDIYRVARESMLNRTGRPVSRITKMVSGF